MERTVYLFEARDGSQVFVEVWDGKTRRGDQLEPAMGVAVRPDDHATWGPPLEFVRKEDS